jgi:hypothetical protein
MAALGLAAVVLAGCGGHAKSATSATPESIVRAWSKALNAGDNEAAARLFAVGAVVIQGPYGVRLATHRMAVEFNASLPCSGEILKMKRKGEVVTAIFVLGDRPASRCDGPNQRAAAAFTIRKGKIVRWEQVPTPQEKMKA